VFEFVNGSIVSVSIAREICEESVLRTELGWELVDSLPATATVGASLDCACGP
jgi:hypothetical protein